MHAAPQDVPKLTPNEEAFLTRLAASEPRFARIIVQWLFVSDGALAVERLRESEAFTIAEEKLSEFILDMVRTLPAESEKYSRAIGFLSQRKDHLRGRTAWLEELQHRLQECDGKDFEDTVAVIQGINSDEGLKALSECYGTLTGKERKKCVAAAITHLQTILATS